MNIDVTVSEVDLASEVGTRYDNDGDQVPMTLADKVAARIAADLRKDQSYGDLRREVLQLRTEEVRRQLEPIVAEAISGELVQTNQFGDPMGKPTTLRELILKEVGAYLKRQHESGYRSTGQTVVQKFVQDAVDTVIKKELAEAIVEEKAKVVAAVRAAAADLIADAVKQGVGR